MLGDNGNNENTNVTKDGICDWRFTRVQRKK